MKRPTKKTFKVTYVVEIRLREVLVRNKTGSKGETLLSAYLGATSFDNAETQYNVALESIKVARKSTRPARYAILANTDGPMPYNQKDYK